MDAWGEEAGCGTIPALYALLLAKPPPPPPPPPASISSSSSSFGGVGQGVMRAAYALLSTPELMKPAVLGLDADIADVDLVLEAMAKAEEEGGDDDDDDDDEDDVEGDEGADGGDGGTTPGCRSRDAAAIAAAAAEKAAMREQLAEALAPSPAALASLDRSFTRGGQQQRRQSSSASASSASFGAAGEEGVMLCWGLLLRYTMRLPPDSPTRERLLDYARVTKAVPRLMAAVMPSLPLPLNGNDGGRNVHSHHRCSRHLNSTRLFQAGIDEPFHNQCLTVYAA